MQITDEQYAKILQRAGQAMDNEFDTIENAANALIDIFNRDKYYNDEGAESYIVRSVIEALFSDIG